MEIKKINCYCVDSVPGKFDFAYYWTDASEEEFKELLDGFLAENSIQNEEKFKSGNFTAYIFKQGYYVHTRRENVFRPRVRQ